MTARYVLDTNVVTALLRQDVTATQQATDALAANAEFLLCPVVFYEIYRGLRYRDAAKQLDFFLNLAATFTWEDLTQDDWRAAGEDWATLRQQGVQITDADLLIGTYAARRGAVIVTANVRHFEALNASVENWLHEDTGN